MKNLFLLTIPVLLFFGIVFVGVPFKINIGDLKQVSNQYTYETTSYTLVNFLILNKGAKIICEADEFCAKLSDPRQVYPSVPVLVESCEPISEKRMRACHKPELKLNINSRIWLTSSFRRML